MLLIRNANVFSPERLGIVDLLIEGEKIAKVGADMEVTAPDDVLEVIDAHGHTVVPGFIDQHVHITGGGGEGGPTARVPESNLGSFLRCGVTTVLGLLGTDGVSRSIENLYAKARALNAEGLTCYMLTGSYAYPTISMSGSVERDIYLLDLCIGVKVAASDHRSNNPTSDDLIRLATTARRAGLIAGKAGIVTVHMGIGKARMKPLITAIETSDLPGKILIPTHVNMREPELLDDCVRFAELGGTFDFTGGLDEEMNRENIKKIKDLLYKGVDRSQITVSSDAFGSMPKFDEKGNLIGLTYSTSKSLPELFRCLVQDGMPVEDALPFFTVNPARVMGLEGRKGIVAAGADADLLMLDDNLGLSDVIVKGRVGMRAGDLVMKGTFED